MVCVCICVCVCWTLTCWQVSISRVATSKFEVETDDYNAEIQDIELNAMTEWDFLSFFFFFFFCSTTQYSVYLFPQPGIKLMLPTLETWRLNHWTTREVPGVGFLDCLSWSRGKCNLSVGQRVNHWTNIFINRVTVLGSHYAFCQRSPIYFQAYHGKSVGYRWLWTLLGTTKCGQKRCIPTWGEGSNHRSFHPK